MVIWYLWCWRPNFVGFLSWHCLSCWSEWKAGVEEGWPAKFKIMYFWAVLWGFVFVCLFWFGFFFPEFHFNAGDTGTHLLDVIPITSHSIPVFFNWLWRWWMDSGYLIVVLSRICSSFECGVPYCTFLFQIRGGCSVKESVGARRCSVMEAVCWWHWFVTVWGSGAQSQAVCDMLAWCKAAAPVESGSNLRPQLMVGALTVKLQLSAVFACFHGSLNHPASWVFCFQT